MKTHSMWVGSDSLEHLNNHNMHKKMNIPFYSTVVEGANFEHADWKDQPCVRQAVIHWRNDLTVSWLERHMEMTQGFFCVGKNPGLLILGEPTHDRDDLDKEAKQRPDLSKLTAFVIPPGQGIIIKKGTWHDFPVSCGNPLVVFVINTKEVVEALGAMQSPAAMNHGDCFKLSLKETFPDVVVRFPDPRPFVVDHALVPLLSPKEKLPRILNGLENYGAGVKRFEFEPWGINGPSVYVVPIVNVEVFIPGAGGPAIQPHLCSEPEIANSGWRDYGNRCGLRRLVQLFEYVGIPATAVVNSEAVKDLNILSILRSSGWELGAHGTTNSTGMCGLNDDEVLKIFSKVKTELTEVFGKEPTTWLSPGFSITNQTARLATLAGFKILLDFVNDDTAFGLKVDQEGRSITALPYSMETNDFSLILGRHFAPKQFAETLEAHIHQLCFEATSSPNQAPKVVCLGLHTFADVGSLGTVGSLGILRTLGIFIYFKNVPVVKK